MDCTAAVTDAIAAAGSAGGGVVKFGLGRYYVKAPLLLPHNVRLVGAGMGKTALYFATQDQGPGSDGANASLPANYSNAPSNMIAAAGPGRFGLEELDMW